MTKYFRMFALFISLSTLTSWSVNAGIILTLEHDGNDNVAAEIKGTGTLNLFHIEPFLHFANDLGFYQNTGGITNFQLDNSIAFAPGLSISSLRLNSSNNGQNDDVVLFFDDFFIGDITYDFFGTSRVNGLSFSSLNVGTYTTNNTSSFTPDSFTLIVKGVEVPEPSTWLILSTSFFLLLQSRKRK